MEIIAFRFCIGYYACMEFLITTFQILILLFSVVIHEVSHGFVAERLGDPTARLAGRLTLNPLKHLDLFGSIILPLMLIITQVGIVFGWAKPVPYNPMNLKNPLKGGALIAAAGPASNIAIALSFGIAFRLLVLFFPASSFIGAFAIFSLIVVQLNILLAIFNLIPIPPLDGSKILFAFLPRSAHHIFTSLERYGMIVLLLFIFFGFSFLVPIVQAITTFILGFSI